MVPGFFVFLTVKEMPMSGVYGLSSCVSLPSTCYRLGCFVVHLGFFRVLGFIFLRRIASPHYDWQSCDHQKTTLQTPKSYHYQDGREILIHPLKVGITKC